MKKALRKIAIYAGVIVGAWIIVGVGVARQKRLPVNDFRPVLVNAENNHFVSKADMEAIVRDIHGRPLAEIPRGELQIAEIEAALRENPYVREVEAYAELRGDLVVEMELRKPLARIMFDNGSGFYLDKSYHKLDLSENYAANILLVRGVDNESLLPRDSIENPQLLALQPFLEHIDQDEFLRAHFSEVVWEADGDLILYPEVGDLVVEFGPPVRIERKFEDLKLFYEQVLNQVGWDKYEQVSLKYRGQVVAQRK